MVSIIGAGLMGRAIAAANLRAGYRVQIADADADVAARVAGELQDAHSSLISGRSDVEELSSAPAVTVATSDAEIAQADLVIEAIPENVSAKRSVFAKIAPHLNGRTIVASNTSSICLSEMADTLPAPEQFCGLHFCHPVAERALVEVVIGETTSNATAVRACAYARALGKTPVKVADRPGFVLNRVLTVYLSESLELLLEGVDPEWIDQAAVDFSMPFGPLRCLDEFGLDVSMAVGGNLLRAYPDRFIPSALLVGMYKAGRRGWKSGGGFYANRESAVIGELDPATKEVIAQRSRTTIPVEREQVSRRMLLPMLLEANRVLDEQVVDSPEVVDGILRDGLGMTSAYRGLFGWAEEVGTETLAAWLEPFRTLGERFEPTGMLFRRPAA